MSASSSDDDDDFAAELEAEMAAESPAAPTPGAPVVVVKPRRTDDGGATASLLRDAMRKAEVRQFAAGEGEAPPRPAERREVKRRRVPPPAPPSAGGGSSAAAATGTESGEPDGDAALESARIAAEATRLARAVDCEAMFPEFFEALGRCADAAVKTEGSSLAEKLATFFAEVVDATPAVASA